MNNGANVSKRYFSSESHGQSTQVTNVNDNSMADTVLSSLLRPQQQPEGPAKQGNDAMESLRSNFISSALSIGALKFGSFILKSGRESPYFFNAGLLSTGALLDAVASSYATLIVTQMPEFDVLFGPAYKGITLAGATALCLHRDHNISVSYAFNRKEAKTHGEGGWVVGAPLNGKRVLILDDVITAGTAIREAVDGIRKEGGKVVGVVVCLDREEVGPNEGTTSAVQDVETNVLNGEGPVKAVVRMRDLMKWLENEGLTTELESMKNYWNRYGVKGN